MISVIRFICEWIHSIIKISRRSQSIGCREFITAPTAWGDNTAHHGSLLLAGWINPKRLFKVAILLKPATILKFHKALVKRKYHQGMSMMAKTFWKTMTFDQGREFADFGIVERGTQCKVFYAHAHSPWLRGTNENTNKRLRRYLPKDTKIKEVEQGEPNRLAEQLNGTPRKCLGYLTPKEALFKAQLKPCRT